MLEERPIGAAGGLGRQEASLAPGPSSETSEQDGDPTQALSLEGPGDAWAELGALSVLPWLSAHPPGGPVVRGMKKVTDLIPFSIF